MKVCIVGLGYVGLPLALASSQHFPTIGFDINLARIQQLQQGIDHTGQFSLEELKNSSLTTTANMADIVHCNLFIITVPTPVDQFKRPDFNPLIAASTSIGKVLKEGDVVVYESTVYPGATEEVCLPLLEKYSSLKSPQQFMVGYSPERINPGDRQHTLTNIKKIISAQNEEALAILENFYGSFIQAGLHKAPSIKVAEAAKIVENVQRDINISLMNELALIFDRLQIETHSVLEAAASKWNFLKFTPGLVGGHCIGVDPYYLTHKAEEVGYHPQVILSGRRINDDMGRFIADKTIKEMIKSGHNTVEAIVTVLGITFKENCPDIRNSKVVDVIRELQHFGIKVQVYDPCAHPQEVLQEYGIELTSHLSLLKKAAGLVLAVSHQQFLDFSLQDYKKLTVPAAVVVDVKSKCPKEELQAHGLKVWRL